MPGMMCEDTVRPADQAGRTGGPAAGAPAQRGGKKTQLMDVDTVVAEVAAAVGLAEGESGIRDILSAVLDAEPAAVREVSRLAELPVPIVAAACNELRKRGIVDTQRPVRFTAAGRDAVAAANGAARLHASC